MFNIENNDLQDHAFHPRKKLHTKSTSLGPFDHKANEQTLQTTWLHNICALGARCPACLIYIHLSVYDVSAIISSWFGEMN